MEVFDLRQPRQARARHKLLEEDELRLSRVCLLLAAIFMGPAALAADADNGKRLAELRCVPCHALAQAPGRVVADAPPFETIARKFALQPEMLAFAILDPHPRMNVALTRREVEDIAAYINTLAK
jgi:mono/diheme cytochrome c family protein